MKAKQHLDPSKEEVNELLLLHSNKDFVSLLEESNKLLKDFPENSILLNLKGTAQAAQGLIKESLSSFMLALNNAKDESMILNNIGITHLRLDDFDEAVVYLEKAIQLNKLYSDAHLNLGNAYRKLGKMAKSIESYDRAIKIDPKLQKAHLYKSLTLKNLGNFEESMESCNEAINLNPHSGIAHKHLSSMLDYTNPEAHHILEMEEIYKNPDLNNEDKIQLAFGLGKAFEDVKEYKKAFLYLKEGNSLYRSTIQYSTEGRKEFFKLLKENFDQEFLKRNEGSELGKNTIFVMGMPRSGTSLVEQILSSHSQVSGAGELRYLKEAVDKHLYPIDGVNFPKNLKKHELSSFKYLGNYYLELVNKLMRGKETKFTVDKMPYNFMHVGIINLCLPQAKIILCEREPIDNCFSIYKQKFGVGNDYAYSMEEIGEYYNLYLDLIDHWTTSLPNRMYKISYEDLTFNQEDQTKNLIKFCDLDWEEACISFHQTEREVHTASSVQVRKPMYTSSVKKWEKYKKELRPLIKVLNRKNL